MPTDRPRHLVTETDPVAQALDEAARRWPQDRDRRARLLVRLALEGHRALVGQAELAHEARAVAVRSTSGALDGLYGPDYLTALRAEWPE